MNKERGADTDYIMNVIHDYSDGKFNEMAALIIDYPPALFFPQLFEFLTGQHYADERNKHLLFVGITVQYIKVIESIEFKAQKGFFECKELDVFAFNDFFR